jgi:RNA 3'-terminal phosphate cyclase
LCRFGQFGTVHSGHADVHDEQPNVLVEIKQAQSLAAVLSIVDLEPEILKEVDRAGTNQGVVIYDKDGWGTGIGIRVIGQRQLLASSVKPQALHLL